MSASKPGEVAVQAPCPECGGTVVGRHVDGGVAGGCDRCWTAYHRRDAESFRAAVIDRECAAVRDGGE